MLYLLYGSMLLKHIDCNGATQADQNRKFVVSSGKYIGFMGKERVKENHVYLTVAIMVANWWTTVYEVQWVAHIQSRLLNSQLLLIFLNWHQ